eukprot:XP_011681654.1 PREDICTED: serine/threonine-protein phosphatase 6 regulatory ankyrin repeat subunit B-like [Strongylocentrotus purpuratus]
MAVQYGQENVIEYLINYGADVEKATPDGQTPLHIAAALERLQATKVILSHGAEINGILDHRDDEALTAIYLATQNGYTQVVESLVSYGASLNIQSHDGKTCLHEAIILSDHTSRKEQTKARHQQISEDFSQHELSPDKALVLYLLEHGAKLDIKDGQGKLPVHYANNEVIRQIIFSR